MYENVYPNLALVLLFVRAKVECGKGLLSVVKSRVITLANHEKTQTSNQSKFEVN